MGLIYKQLTIAGTRTSQRIKVLMDTGASYSFLRRREARRLGPLSKAPEPLTVQFGKGKAKVSEALFAMVHLNHYRIPWTFYVIPGLTEQAVIGVDFFQRYRIKLDPRTERIVVDPRYLVMKLI